MLIWPRSGARNDYAPLGIGYLGAVLEHKGCEVLIIDASAPTADYSEDDLVQEAYRFSPDLIGITFNIFVALRAYSLARKLKPMSIPLVAGGPHPSARPHESLSRSFDFVIRKEGERTISELVDYIEGNRSLEEIRGISFRHGDRQVDNPDQELIEDLDILPFPALHLYRQEDYAGPGAEFASHIVGTRGCPYDCSFCYKVFGGRRIRWRSAESIVEEMTFVNKNYHQSFFRFVDEFFACDRRRLQEFCELILKKDLKFQWFANSRVDALDPELLSLMKRSGCFELAFGFESGDEETIGNINKDASLEQAKDVMNWLKDVGIRLRAYIMCGFPWDTPESVGNTLRFLEKNKDMINIFFPLTYFYPFPKTALYEKYVDKFDLEGWWLEKKYPHRYAPGDYMPIHHILLFGDLKLRWKKGLFPLPRKTRKACRKLVDYMARKNFDNYFPPHIHKRSSRFVLYSIAKVSQITFTWSTPLWRLTMFILSRIVKQLRPNFPFRI